MSAKPLNKYQAEIDGLRAIAIIMVIIYHTWPQYLSGGFVGVDIFFVISGYLITSIISKQLLNNSFTFIEFYKRRIKRILPAYYAMVFCASIIAFILLTPSNYNTFLKSAASSSLFISNWYFYQLSSYFSVGVMEYPLLHTWSLSVEEQYYIFWPLILILFFKYWPTRLKSITLCMYVCSLSFAIYCAIFNPDLGYYSPFSRTFEFMTGSLLAINISNKVLIPHTTKINPIIMANITSTIGIILVVASSFIISDTLPFPSYFALFPTLGTTMIIYAGHMKHKNPIIKFLELKPIVFIGLISYSLYIWHWPILAFWHYYNPGKPINITIGICLISLAMLFTLFSYYYIEKPIRESQYTFKQVFILFYLIPTVLIILSMSLSFFKPRINNKLRQEMTFVDKKYCFGQITGDCIVGDLSIPGDPNIILFGDSHAGMIAPFWDQIGHQFKFKFKSLSTGACYPLIDPYHNLPNDLFKRTQNDCKSQIKYLTENINKFQIVIISAAWPSYFNMSNSSFVFETQFESMINYLISHNKKIILVGDFPVFNNNVISTTLRQEMLPIFANKNNKQLINKNESSSFHIYNKKLQNIKKKYPNVYLLNLENTFEAIPTFPFINDFLIYNDNTHISQVGSIMLADKYLQSSDSVSLKKLLKDWEIIK